MDDRAPTESVELTHVLRWHGGWSAVVIAGAALIAAALGGVGPSQGAALALGAAPGLAGLLLLRFDSRRARTALLCLWSVCAAGACALTGGVTGPLAVWCLAPLAAASTFAPRTALAQGAALSLGAAAICGLLQLGGGVGSADQGAAGLWLALLALATTGLGLGAGLILSLRRDGVRDDAQRLSEAALATLLREQPHLVLSLNGSGEIGAAFGHAPQGLQLDQLAGANLYDVAALNSRGALRNAVRTAVIAGQAEADFSPSAAPDRVCALTLRRGPDGRIAAVVRDASRDRWREAELEASRAEAENLNAGKSRFLANMSHELRTPLNAIMGFSDMMKARLFGDLSPRYAEYAELIHESGRHLLDLINDVLDMSKIEAERYQLSLRGIRRPRGGVGGAAPGRGCRPTRPGCPCAACCRRTAWRFDADRRALKQIVLNLVSNALKFTPRGGSVTVIGPGRAARCWRSSVSDTGVGIAPEDLERLGRPYEQAGDADQRARAPGSACRWCAPSPNCTAAR